MYILFFPSASNCDHPALPMKNESAMASQRAPSLASHFVAVALTTSIYTWFELDFGHMAKVGVRHLGRD